MDWHTGSRSRRLDRGDQRPEDRNGTRGEGGVPIVPPKGAAAQAGLSEKAYPPASERADLALARSYADP